MTSPTYTLLGVCVGKGKAFPNKTGATGIDKRPVLGPVEVKTLGLVGDEVMDSKHHGGPDQAVYLYTQPDYDYWTEVLGEAPAAGAFGENLLISGPASAEVQIGQRFRIGSVLLEAAASRIPCETFAAHMHDPLFVKKFRQARRPGIYARVIEEGTLQAGDPVTLEGHVPADAPTILDTFEFFYDKQPTPQQVQRLLAAPVAVRLRRELEEQAAKFAAGR